MPIALIGKILGRNPYKHRRNLEIAIANGPAGGEADLASRHLGYTDFAALKQAADAEAAAEQGQAAADAVAKRTAAAKLLREAEVAEETARVNEAQRRGLDTMVRTLVSRRAVLEQDQDRVKDLEAAMEARAIELLSMPTNDERDKALPLQINALNQQRTITALIPRALARLDLQIGRITKEIDEIPD